MFSLIAYVIVRWFICSFPHFQSLVLWQACVPCTDCTTCGLSVCASITRGGCRKCLWQVITTYKDADCVFAEWKRAFQVLFNAASVHVWMHSALLQPTGLECVFLSTHVCTYWRVKMTFCQMQQRKTYRTENYIVWHSYCRVCYPAVVCVRERDLVENVRCWLFSAARWNALHVFFHAVVDFCVL